MFKNYGLLSMYVGWDGKESASKAIDPGSVPGSERSPGEGHSNPLQYYCLENSRIEEPGGLQSMWLQRVEHNWVTNTIDILLIVTVSWTDQDFQLWFFLDLLM